MSDVHPFKVVSNFQPAGDQPNAITALVDGIEEGLSHQTLLGVTGSGKTFTIAKVIEQPAAPDANYGLHLTRRWRPNSTVSSKIFFRNNSVEYFVSYYDYYQPEAYVAVVRYLYRKGFSGYQCAHRADAVVSNQGAAGATATRSCGGICLGDLRPG